MLAETMPLLAQAAGQDQGLIDWLTVGAQIFNFLLLVWLLKRLLYGRVIRAMDRREGKIASHFQAAEQKEKEAAETAHALAREKDELRRKREGLLNEAASEAQNRRRELFDQAREEVRAQAARWREELRHEKESFLNQLHHRTGREVCDIARKALADLADERLERRVVGVLLARLGDLGEEDRRRLEEALNDSGRCVTVATGWDFPQDARPEAIEAVHKRLGDDLKVDFQTAPELSCGIELRAGGREISWTVDAYIQGLRDRFAEAIDEKIASDSPLTGPGGPRKPAPPRAEEADGQARESHDE